jgi:hypothetical protein
MVKHGKAWESIGKHGKAWYRIHRIQHGTAQYGFVRMVQHSMPWYSMVSIVKSGTAR